MLTKEEKEIFSKYPIGELFQTEQFITDFIKLNPTNLIISSHILRYQDTQANMTLKDIYSDDNLRNSINRAMRYNDCDFIYQNADAFDQYFITTFIFLCLVKAKKDYRKFGILCFLNNGNDIVIYFQVGNYVIFLNSNFDTILVIKDINLLKIMVAINNVNVTDINHLMELMKVVDYYKFNTNSFNMDISDSHKLNALKFFITVDCIFGCRTVYFADEIREFHTNYEDIKMCNDYEGIIDALTEYVQFKNSHLIKSNVMTQQVKVENVVPFELLDKKIDIR